MKSVVKHTSLSKALLLAFVALLVASCARMGRPDGGWYDETPPRVVGASPADQATGVKARKIYINFSEFIKMDNATEKVVVSPPQTEPAEIKASGKRIVVELKDSLRENTTYTIDFSDAISDNNEGNPLGNYTYTFSTGDEIDTMQVGGAVVDASNLEPVKGILVGLYANLADSAFRKEPMLRVARTDSRGRFTIKGVAPGTYRVYALQDQDGNYMYSQPAEMLAFQTATVTPSFKDDFRQDTLWQDSLHIKSITREKYTHFLPDDIVLRAFTAEQTYRYLIKSERPDPRYFSFYFSYGNPQLPRIEGLNFNADNAFYIEKNLRCDTLTYWLRDTALVNMDTLNMAVTYLMTDSMGQLVDQTDTLMMLAKVPYARRLKQEQKKIADWQKQQDKAKKRGDKYETEYPRELLKPTIGVSTYLDPDQNIRFDFDTPLQNVDTSKIHLYALHDSLWYQARFIFQPAYPKHPRDSVEASTPLSPRQYELLGEWRPDVEYSLEIDSLAFQDIYGLTNGKSKTGFKVKQNDAYGTLLITLSSMQGKRCVVQLLDQQGNPVKEAIAEDGRQAEFFYLAPKKYYLRLFIDDNHNGLWDTGDYDRQLQPELMYYYPKEIECREKWDINLSWNPTERPANEQKPSAIVKQKAEQKRKIANRNAKRAKDKGIEYVP